MNLKVTVNAFARAGLFLCVIARNTSAYSHSYAKGLQEREKAHENWAASNGYETIDYTACSTVNCFWLLRGFGANALTFGAGDYVD